MASQVTLGGSAVFQEQVLTQLVIQSQKVILMEVIIEIQSCLNQFIPFLDGQLLGHFTADIVVITLSLVL